MKKFVITEEKIMMLVQIASEIKQVCNEDETISKKCDLIIEVLFFIANSNLA